MARRFTVIQGGLSGMPVAASAPHSGPAEPDVTAESTAWRVDLRAPDAVGEEAVSAWRRRLIRHAVRDPDHLLPLAQRCPAGRRVALAWSQDTETGREALRGVVPLAMSHPVWGGRARPWQPAEAAARALVENPSALAVDRALRARLAGLRRPIRLVDSVEPVRIKAPFRPRLAADRSARPRSIPAGNLVGTRPFGWAPPATGILAVTEPETARDAVETLLNRDAGTAHRPIIADPSEASRVRAVSRLFGRGAAFRAEFLRRAGEIVAGTLHLGVGGTSVPWRRARV